MKSERHAQEEERPAYRSLVTDVQLAIEATAAVSPLAAVYLHHELTSGKDEPSLKEPPPNPEPPKA